MERASLQLRVQLALLLALVGSAIQGVEEKKQEWKAKCEQMLNSLQQIQAASLSSPWQAFQGLPGAQVDDNPDGSTVLSFAKVRLSKLNARGFDSVNSLRDGRTE